MSETAHSELGFSIAERYLNCPGSVVASRGIAREQSRYATEGTDAHALGEVCLKRNLPPSDFVGSYVGSTLVTHEMAEAVAVYLETVRALMNQLGPEAQLHVETRADCTALHPDLWGTMDAMIVVPFVRAVVIDLKYGVNLVEADCDQGRGYALHPWLHYDVGEVTFGIVQPRASHPDGPVRMQTYSRVQLEAEAARFKAGAYATAEPNAPRHAGKWCKYCPVAKTCPALHNRSLAIAQADFAASPPVVPPLPSALSNDELGTLLPNLEILEDWIKAVYAHALDRGLQGQPPTGFKVVSGRRGARKWADPAVAATALEAAEVDCWERPELKSPATIEKALGAPAFKAYDGLTAQADGKPQLAPVSDKRPALPASAISDFLPSSI